MLPLGEFVEDPQQVDAAGHVPPAVDGGVPHLQRLRCQLGLLPDDAAGEVEESDVVLAANVGHDVLVEELQHQRNTVSKDEMLRHELKLIDVVDLEMLQQKQEDSGARLNDDLLISVNALL